MTSGAEDETYEAVITLLDEHCDFGDTNSEIKQKFMLATNSNKLKRYCFRNPDITSENLLTYTDFRKCRQSSRGDREDV